MRKARRFISRKKQVFLVGFSLTFPRFLQISKNRLNTSLVELRISCRFGISFQSKWRIWNLCRFEYHFASIHLNTGKELIEHRSEIFNRKEISYRFEFISPLMWTYSTSVRLKLKRQLISLKKSVEVIINNLVPSASICCNRKAKKRP